MLTMDEAKDLRIGTPLFTVELGPVFYLDVIDKEKKLLKVTQFNNPFSVMTIPAVDCFLSHGEMLRHFLTSELDITLDKNIERLRVGLWLNGSDSAFTSDFIQS